MGGGSGPCKLVCASIAADVNVGGAVPERRPLAHVRLDPPDARAVQEGPSAVLEVGVQLAPEFKVLPVVGRRLALEEELGVVGDPLVVGGDCAAATRTPDRDHHREELCAIVGRVSYTHLTLPTICSG
eukprot:2323126-Alexandrium_andersonii.AAC.1